MRKGDIPDTIRKGRYTCYMFDLPFFVLSYLNTFVYVELAVISVTIGQFSGISTPINAVVPLSVLNRSVEHVSPAL